MRGNTILATIVLNILGEDVLLRVVLNQPFLARRWSYQWSYYYAPNNPKILDQINRGGK